MNNGTHELVVDSLYKALIQLMNKKPYKEITISEIVKRAGVSRMAYYRNYNSKNDILLNRFSDTLSTFNKDLISENISDQKFWFISLKTLLDDNTLLYVIKAGLYKQLLDIHLNFVQEYHKSRLGADFYQINNQFQMYQNIGKMIGLMLYIKDLPHKPNDNELIHIINVFLMGDNVD